VTRIEQHNRRITEEEVLGDLALWLEFAVPLFLAELAVLPDPERTARINAWRADAVPGLGAADALMFRAKRGQAEMAATATAKGVAAAAALLGEVEMLGLRFVWPGARPPVTDHDPDANDEPDDAGDAGEWYGTRPVQVVEIPGVSR
jgi:hypothetical protein